MDTQNFAYKKLRSGTISATASPFLAGPGEYTVNVIVMAENYNNFQEKSQYFSENALLFDSHSRVYELTIARTDDQPLKNDIVFLHPIKWNVSNNVKISNT